MIKLTVTQINDQNENFNSYETNLKKKELS